MNFAKKKLEEDVPWVDANVCARRVSRSAIKVKAVFELNIYSASSGQCRQLAQPKHASNFLHGPTAKSAFISSPALFSILFHDFLDKNVQGTRKKLIRELAIFFLKRIGAILSIMCSLLIYLWNCELSVKKKSASN